jgi:hypothetical protein
MHLFLFEKHTEMPIEILHILEVGWKVFETHHVARVGNLATHLQKESFSRRERRGRSSRWGDDGVGGGKRVGNGCFYDHGSSRVPRGREPIRP